MTDQNRAVLDTADVTAEAAARLAALAEEADRIAYLPDVEALAAEGPAVVADLPHAIAALRRGTGDEHRAADALDTAARKVAEAERIAAHALADLGRWRDRAERRQVADVLDRLARWRQRLAERADAIRADADRADAIARDLGALSAQLHGDPAIAGTPHAGASVTNPAQLREATAAAGRLASSLTAWADDARRRFAAFR